MERPEYPPHSPTPSPVPYLSHIGKSGQDTLWATYVIFVITTLYIATLAARLDVKHRALHLLALGMTAVAALSYYAMATHSGVSYIPLGWRTIQGEETLVLRQVFWARYIDWLVAVVSMFLSLAVLAGLPWLDVLLLGMATGAATFLAAFAALSQGSEMTKWGWYAHSLLFFFIFLPLLVKGRRCAKQQPHDPVCRHYTALTIYICLVWAIYAVVFALGEMKGIINVNTEVIAYAGLDIASKVVFPLWLVLGYSYENEDNHIMRFSDAWTEVRGKKGTIRLQGREN